jgi:uncharacterized protein
VKGMAELEAVYGNFYAPSFQILVAGRDVREMNAEVSSVSVEHCINAADSFGFSVNNPYDPARGDFAWSDDPMFDVGTEVAVRMGYGNRMETMTLGMITSVRVSFPAGGGAKLDVSGYDLSHRMAKGKRQRSWSGKKHSEIVQQIAGEYSFTPDVEDSVVVHPLVKQDDASDYEFIIQLAGLNGFEVFMTEKTMHFRKPARSVEPVVSLTWGRALSAFAPEVNVAAQVTQVKVIGWDPGTKTEIVGTAAGGDEDGKTAGRKSGSEVAGQAYPAPVVQEIRRPVFSQAEADHVAKACLNKLAEELVSGTGECIGLPILRPGTRILLDGLGRKFSKAYYIEKTSHAVGTSGYKTTFTVKDNSI